MLRQNALAFTVKDRLPPIHVTDLLLHLALKAQTMSFLLSGTSDFSAAVRHVNKIT